MLSPEELQAARTQYGIGNSTSSGGSGSPSSQPVDHTARMARLSKMSGSQTTQPSAPAQSGGFFSDVGNAVHNVGEGLKKAWDMAPGPSSDLLGTAAKTAESGLQSVGSVAKGINDVASSASEHSGLNAVGGRIMNLTPAGVAWNNAPKDWQDTAKGIAGQAAGAVAGKYDEFKQQHPEAAQNIENAGQIAQAIPTIEGASSLAKVGKEGLGSLWDKWNGGGAKPAEAAGLDAVAEQTMPGVSTPTPNKGAPKPAVSSQNGLKLAEDASPISDKVKQQATKSGIQPRLIDLVEGGSAKDRAAMRDMVQKAEGYSGSFMAEHPTQVNGKTFVEHVKPIQEANAKAGKVMGDVVTKMGDKNVSVIKPTLDFLDSLKELNIDVGEDGKLDFGNSTLQGAQGGETRTMLQDAYSKLEQNKDGMTAREIQAYKESLGKDLGLGSGKQVIDNQAKAKVEGLRRGLGDALGDVSSKYRAANKTYAVTQHALDSFDQLMGSKFGRVTPEVLQDRAAEVAGRLQGNVPANIERVMSDIEAAHKHIGFSPGSDLKRQAYFSGALKQLFDLTKPASFAGGVEEGTKNALENVGTGIKALHNPTGAAVDVGMKFLNQARSPKAQVAALKALLGMK